MDEEYYRGYLQSLQPMLPVGEGWASNAIAVPNMPESQRLAYEKDLHFGRGQTAARMLRAGLLDRGNQDRALSGVKYPKDGYDIWGHDSGHDVGRGTFRKVHADTPLPETEGLDNYAVVPKGDDPTRYFTPLETINGVGYNMPDLNFENIRGIPEQSQRNVRAHQMLEGLRTALRTKGLTDDDLRRIGIDGYDGVDATALSKLKRATNDSRVMGALETFLGQSSAAKEINRMVNAYKDVDNFIRSNYRPGEYYSMPEGVPERTRLYAKGGAMPKASPERIRHEGRVLSRVGGNEREDWYL